MKEEDIQSLSLYSGEPKSEFAIVMILGSLGKLSGGGRLESEKIGTPVKLADLLESLSTKYGLVLRRDSTLILVNGVEANALEDLDTVVSSGDHVSLIPMFHGG